MSKDNVPALLRLLATGFDVNQRSPERNKTPLHIACENNAVVVFEFLMHNGADACVVDDDGNSPLHYAAYSGSQTMVKQLLERASKTINLLNKQQQTPLHWAVFRGFRDVAELLCKKGAEQLVDYMGKRPRDYTTSADLQEILDAQLSYLSYVHREPIDMDAALRVHVEEVIEVGSAPRLLKAPANHQDEPEMSDSPVGSGEHADTPVSNTEDADTLAEQTQDTNGDEAEFVTASAELPPLNRPMRADEPLAASEPVDVAG